MTRNEFRYAFRQARLVDRFEKETDVFCGSLWRQLPACAIEAVEGPGDQLQWPACDRLGYRRAVRKPILIRGPLGVLPA